ncbi:uncharacterized protein LOC111246655 isoform X2 [Varroa destructor]|uniref:Uncharacterized protein n=1 Tax=Varroa destructor TaxID=109461 RepID=A0A7M7JLL6_VARDE|nr:uncharacterized protein LOC111246655 isoform X2 [Varroa destructor]
MYTSIRYKMGYRQPREIHYELTPATRHRQVSVFQLAFAIVVGTITLAAILLALCVIWYGYSSPSEVTSIIYNQTDEVLIINPTRPVERVPNRKHFEVIVVYADDNKERADNVVSYLNKTLRELIDTKIYSDIRISKVGSKSLQSTTSDPRLKLKVPLRYTVKLGSTVIIVSEQFPPTAEQVINLVRLDSQRPCRLLDEERCVELCAIYLTPGNVPNITPAVTEYEAVDVRIANLVDYAQNSAIYRQGDNQLFSVARFRRGCLPTS